MTGDYTITVHDPKADPDEVIAERCAYSHVVEREMFPDEPPTPVDQAVAFTRALPERMRMWSFRARDAEGRLAAMASTHTDPEHESNPDVFFVSVSVLPEHRRRGLGGRLLGELVGLARDEGRTRLIGRTHEGVPAGAAFAAAVGGEAKQADHINHLPLAGVDRPMLEQWVTDGPRRAAGYELIAFDNRVPDELLEAYVDLILVLNTAPRDDLEIEDFTLTPEEVREDEERREAAKLENWALVARNAETGELAGFHDVTWNPANPAVVWVGGTAVKPEHRGHALGKWLKAAMTLRVLDERPQVTEIRTGNADSNDAMLGINRAMGYRPMLAFTAWEVSVDTAERWFATRRERQAPAPA